MKTRRTVALAAAVSLLAPVAGAQAPAKRPPAAAAHPAKPPAAPAWVKRSNVNTRYVLDALAKFGPEGAGQAGVEGLDERITDLTPGYRERVRAASQAVIAELRKRLDAEQDPQVRQDLQILLTSQERSLQGDLLQEKYFVPYTNVGDLAFSGLRALLDDQVSPERRKAALVRLRRYAGVEPGTTPVAELAMADTRAAMKRQELLFPAKAELDRDLEGSEVMLDGLAPLFERYGLQGYQEPLAKLKAQLAAYDGFVRTELLPRARTDFRLPPEVYAQNLERIGVDLPPEQLMAQAHQAYAELQAQMQTVAAQVAKARGFKDPDYRAVIRELKKEQLVGEAILPHYQARLKDLEGIIRREHLLTLPARPARIRLASEAESAQSPAPHMRPPRLLGNTGEQGEFVLPLNMPSKDPAKAKRFDDFTFAAASWTLTAHEARPGHELQFAKVLEAGVSDARAIFAFNSTNVEGWGLYAERIALPFMPPEGQLISLQHRLLRAARAFSDPELQLGRTTPEKVKALLMQDVMLSDGMATQEVERYTFRSPGQATSYFYGFTRLNALRTEVEAAQGKRFDARRFHDFILAQGLLPPDLLRTAVLAEFVGAGKAAGSK
ncbi:DUF885 domain-containing protein [Aggregicoccus sp. 17bor-14]|uniref:DUF885 domain-containing protein n=1 Tax=Myxococcaceae TaxID=31 RepID=UPI00129C252F|nr:MULTISPECIES: DUF885 domain-containing protein [Myxococcaceae]MBF5044560.1 DUF885 domain-containing protein [Simulacricoccus sp. 17bor-14]MRI90305.1 DUF885 domain-containing protein [Aggregicoccus sp. 17bor-14]